MKQTLACGSPQPMLGLVSTSLKYHRVALKRASLTIVGEALATRAVSPPCSAVRK